MKALDSIDSKVINKIVKNCYEDVNSCERQLLKIYEYQTKNRR